MRVLAGIILGLTIAGGCANDTAGDLSRYLPQTGDLETWRAADTVRTYVGQDLFLLINGGAELYHKHGFVQLVSQTFENLDGHQISIECYEMNSLDGAREVYESKISAGGEKLPIGEGATFSSYYLNFHQDNFLVTLVAYDTDTVTIKGLKGIAEVISRKMND